MQLKALAPNINVVVSLHNALNYTKGVIYSNDLREIDENIILKELAHHQISVVKKILKKVMGNLIETGLIILTFCTHVLPEHIMIGYRSTTVREYIPLPTRCNNCFEYGHVQKICKTNKICYNCGDSYRRGPHNNEKCTRPPKCTYCNEDKSQDPHNSVNRRCRIFKIQQELIAIITKNKEERYSRVPRLSDTRYSAKWRYASSKARSKCATYRRYTDLSVMGVRVGVAIFFGSIDRY